MTRAPDFQVAGPLPDRRHALEASAGTGKTYALTALAVRYVAETELKLPEILLVTFTRMATAELRERVRRGLGEATRQIEGALADPNVWARRFEEGDRDPVIGTVVGSVLRDRAELQRRRARLLEATGELDEATIATIHGFCQRMLQHAALEAGVDFDAVLLDDDAELRDEIVDDWTALELRGADPEWIRYLRTAKVDRKRLQGLARAVTGLPSLELRPEIADPGAAPEEVWQEAFDELRTAWDKGGAADMERLVAELKDQDAFATRRQQTYTPAKVREQAEKMDDWLARAPRYPDQPISTPVPGDRPTTHPLRYFSATGLGLFLADGRPPALGLLGAADRTMRASTSLATGFLHRTARYVWEQLEQRKRQRTLLTYDDLLRRLAAALEQPRTADAVRRAIRQRYRVALIDEFQDTDPIQWRIFDAVFGHDEPLVLIGDPKQAIYAFRGADVRTYVRARETAGRVETLRANHRSDCGHVEAINHLFDRDGVFAERGIAYRRLETRHGNRLQHPGEEHAPLRIRFVRDEAGPTAKGKLQKGWADGALPDDVAATVVDLLESPATIEDGDRHRRLQPRDIAVLVRKNDRALRVQEALRAVDVPAVIQRGGSVYDTKEAEWLQRLLDALLRPGADRPATAAAAIPALGRDAPTLAAQREAADQAEEWSGAAANDPARAGQWERWLDRLHAWAARWQRQGVIAAIRGAFDEEEVPQRLLGQPGGDRSLTNLWHLAELLHTAEATEGLGPTALADWLRERRDDAVDRDQPDAETELRLEEDAEAVRILTIHGSKGMQYPIVLCPDLWDGRVREDPDLRFHDTEAEDPTAAITLDIDVDGGSPSRQDSQARARQEALAEHLRIAYVALTRAEHAGVLWWGRFADATTSPLASLLHSGGDEGAADDLLAAARAHVARASDEQLLSEVEALAAASGGTIAVEALSQLPEPHPWEPERPPAPSLEARSFTRGDVDRSWRRTSFTSLVRPASGHEAPDLDPREGRDIDAEASGPSGVPAVAGPDAAPAPIGASESGLASDPSALDLPLGDFPAGPGPGVFLHDVLERLDFAADADAVEAIVAEQERRHGIDPGHREAAVAGLLAALGTPLGPIAGDVRLRDIPRRRRLDEMRFELPLAGGHEPSGGAVNLRAVADLIAGSDDPLVAGYAPALADPALSRGVRGFLTGAIDLVAGLPGGRFLVVDYKSNLLRDPETGRCTSRQYRPSALAADMVGHHYVLQALLYLVATHRYLRWRLGASYRYDTHVAGAAYLFLRGMTGPSPAGGSEQPGGVVAMRPEGELVEALSALLDDPGGRR